MPAKLAYPSCVVLGGRGFIGQHLMKALQERDVNALSVGSRRSHTLHDVEFGAPFIGGLINQTQLANLPFKPGVLFHLAGGSSVADSVENPEADFDLTVGSTTEVLEYLKAHNRTCHLILVSSAAVYGSGSTGPENPTLNPVSPYGLHKKIAEDLCRSYAETHGLRISIVRPFSVYGPGLRKQLLWDALNKADHAHPTFFGTGEEIRDWVYISDLVDLLLLIGNDRLPHLDGRPINAGTGAGTSVKHVITMLLDFYTATSEPRFIGTAKSGDPTALIAQSIDPSVREILSKVRLEQGLRNYVDWYQKSARPC